MRIVSGFRIRKIADEIVAVPTGASAKRLSGIVSLNEVIQFLFEELENEHTEQSLVSALMNEYEVDQHTAESDIKEFLDYLRSFNLLEE